MTQRKLFNWKKRHANRVRAAHWHTIGRIEGADFLLIAALQDLALRLSTLERHFETALILDAPNQAIGMRIAHVLENHSPAMKYTIVPSDETQEPDSIMGEDERFDIAISLLALQDYDRLPERLTTIRQKLKPDGLFMACLLGGGTLHQLRQSLLAIEPDMFGGVRARIHPMIDIRDIGGLLQRAGFALPVADIEDYTVHYDDIFALINDLRAMGATSFLNREGTQPIHRDFWNKVNSHYKQHFSNAKGRIAARFDMLWLSGWAPASSQPKPLKRGSATHSLKDALKTINDK